MRKFAIPVVALMFALLAGSTFTGCVQRITDYTVMSTKEVDVAGKYVKKEQVEGNSMVAWFIFPFGKPTFTKAVDDALEKSGGEFLTDVVVEQRWYGVLVIGAIGFRVRGNYWVPASGSDLEGENLSNVYELQETEDGMAMVNVEDPTLVSVVVDENNFEEVAEVVQH